MTSLKPKVKRVRPLLGTYVEIELFGDAPADMLHAWITTGFEAVADVDRLMNLYRTDSDLAALNRAGAGQWVPVHPQTLTVLKASNAFWRFSKGIFDIRCAKGLCSSAPIRFRKMSVSKTGSGPLDLGGIAKGYAVDCAVEKIKALSRGQAISGIVNAGGDLRRWGPQWPAIAVATSAVRATGNAERLSPARHVQMPSGQILRREKAVSVLSERCLWSDALTKIVMMGSRAVALSCLSSFRAHAIVFGERGQAEVLA